MSKIPYASIIGSIMYAMLCTRPDVSYALSMTSRYQSDLGESTGQLITTQKVLFYTLINTVFEHFLCTNQSN